MITAQRRPAQPVPLTPSAWDVRQHRKFFAAEALLVAAMVALAVMAKLHPGPFPGDLGLSVAWERVIRPSQTLTTVVELFGNATWPAQAIAIAVGISVVFALLRRWLDIVTSLVTAGVASLSNYTIMQIVQRPRPVGSGLHVNAHVGFPSFPSGHVEHAIAYFGFILFLTFMVQRPQRWLWIVHVALILLIVMIGPSRLVTGEHWPSDILAGYISGAFWLLLAIQIYHWAAGRWPQLVPRNERREQSQEHAEQRETTRAV